MTEGPRVNFVMRDALFEIYNGSSVFDTSMRNKQVEFNTYIYTLSTLSCFGYEISVFKINNRAVFRTAAGAAYSYVTLVACLKNG